MTLNENNPANKTSRRKKATAPTEESGRIQPQARELEEAVLGALMLEKDAYSLISEIIAKPDFFYDKTHELIFESIQELAFKQKPIDMLTVIDQLRKKGDLETIGGASYITQLTQKVVSSAHIEYHARIIAQKYLARQLISFSSRIASEAFDETKDVDDLMQEAESQLFELSKENLKKDVTQIDPVLHEAHRLITEAAKRDDGLSGVASGFNDLDKLTLGWQRSDLIIIAARPAMGKTAFVLSMIKNMAVNMNTPVALFSLEMSNVQLVNRMIVNVTEITADKIKSGRLENHEWAQLDAKIQDLFGAPIYIDDTPGLSVFELRTKARRLVKEHKIQCIVIDYLQLMTANVGVKGSRELEVSTISRSLKGLAKELNIPIIALSQLNRDVEKSMDKKDSMESRRPQLSNLRESGAIEQDADIVCFIHRPEYYKIFQDSQGRDLTGKAEIIIAKHRNGATDDVLLSFKKEYARFQNLNDDKIQEELASRYNSLSDIAPQQRAKGGSIAPPGNDVPY